MKIVDISVQTILKIIFVPTTLYLVWANREILFSLFLAFIFMSALRPLVGYLNTRFRLKRNIASLVVFVLAIAVIAIFLGGIIPPLISETIVFFERLPTTLKSLDPSLLRYIRLEEVSKFVPDFANQAANIIGNIFSNTLFVVTTIFFSYYFLANEHTIDEKLLNGFLSRYLSQKKIKNWLSILHFSQSRLAAWFWGEIALMTVIGLTSYIAFSIVGLKYALPLAVLAGFLEAVPNIGPTIAAIPAILIGFGQSPVTGVAAFATSFIIQQLENNILVPYIMKKAVGLNPIVTMIAVLLGLKIAGPIGALLAIPTYVLVESIYIERARIRVEE
jgi:predicted PurR-regulated permease PerM